jgi:hypothetical protein
LLERFEYRDGELYRKVAPQGSKVGDKVGAESDRGYKQTTINCKHFKNHRLIFMMHHGHMPERVDHINGDVSDNRIENLREATQTENMRNRKISKTNRAGVKNVSWSNHAKSWRVDLKVGGKNQCLGYFKDLEAAELVAHLAREKYYGNFARHI